MVYLCVCQSCPVFHSRSNGHGQIGCGSRIDAVVPRELDQLQDPIKTIAAGAHHTVVVTGKALLHFKEN